MPNPTEADVMNAVAGLPDPQQLAGILGAGGNPNSKVDGETALGRAVVLGYEEKVRVLLSHGADPNLHDDPDAANHGRFTTPLIDATRSDARVPILKALLEAGADPNQRDSLGMTALMQAALLGASGAVDALIEGRADAALETDSEQTALHFAMTRDRPEIVRRLISMGLDPNKPSSNNGASPAQLAKKRNLSATLQLLSQLGFA